jgi:hypothetical protein
MKFKVMMMMIAMVAFLAITVKAQQPDESRVKILPTEKPGVLKLVHAISTDEPITVNFITNEGFATTDVIKGSYPRGIAKRYDFRRINDSDFRMQISSAGLTLIYHIIPSEDKKTFTSTLEQAIRHYDVVVASR